MASDVIFIEKFQDLPIYGKRKSFTIQVTKIEIIVSCNIFNFIGTQPKDFELTMFTYLFNSFIPHENQIAPLEVPQTSLLVEFDLNF